VLKSEFKDFVPFETDSKVLDAQGPEELGKLRDNTFIELIDSTVP